MDKHALREQIWDALEDGGHARFPFPPHGRIPNFAEADVAADRVAHLEAWTTAGVLKCNPDAPQLPIRRMALRAGKTVYMAVPRLREKQCFLRLDPACIDDFDRAATISGSSEVGHHVGPKAVEPIDLIVTGSVAVNEAGARVGKGEGYSDLEFAILREHGLVSNDTTTVTTVHEVQVVTEKIPTTPQDVPIDWIATPDRTIKTVAPTRKPERIDWDVLDPDRIVEIPILQELQGQGETGDEP